MTETESKTPPIEWYSGLAWPGDGIRWVRIGTEAFYTLHEELRLHMGNWGHTQLAFGRTEYESPEQEEFHKAEGLIVQELTGFDPELLMEYARKLEREYKGCTEAPFEIIWFKN